ncbi:type II toxin-antitoxin system PemK/MazF family toxin [Staphylococcus hominis]|uniref:type II toxin-antitoxin system PemK/MazF family toxin n=1 Tax=Staphylococcus hominis TaxID=1290 RepID=UPI0021CE000E|nr:type II toxin-antitoxin system PemK/MazF family toxin [Staphylococcus hominis]UXR84394.1 type II toxin-antitoxin system PemK/MazF family toxin [Staphylococcus hominis]
MSNIESNSLEKQNKTTELNIWSISKEELAHEWIDLDNSERNRNLRQGDVVFCELGENLGYEINKPRPVLVVSDTRYSKQGQFVGIPLTKNNTRRSMATHYTLYKSKYSFLQYDSCVKTEQLKSLSAIRVDQKIGSIDQRDLNSVKIRLNSLFGM